MGNCFTACTKSKDGDSSPGREKEAKGKRRAKWDKTDINARKNSPSSTLKDNLFITSVEASNDFGDVGTKTECFSEGHQSTEADLTVIGHALPILEKPESLVIEPGVSNTRTIVVEASTTSENSSKETFPGEGIKRPITRNESNTSSLSSFGAEETKCNDDLEVICLDKETSATVPPPRESERPENPERTSYFQLLEFLKIRLDMAANNMEINRLLTNVDRALERTSRARELGFQRMRAAAESQRAAQDIQEEDGTDREETENDEGDEGGETPPPPIPRVCWQ